MRKLIIILIIGLTILLSAALLYNYYFAKPKSPTILLSASNDVKEIVRLTSLEGERIVPVTYKKNGIGAFGIGHYNTRISFDIEKIEDSIVGDTLFIRLPEPQIKILENQQNGFRVLDVWGENIFTRIQGPHLSVDAENEMKRNAITALQSELRKDGSVQRAKEQATEMILKMFSLMPGTVIVLDETTPLHEGNQPTYKYIPIDK